MNKIHTLNNQSSLDVWISYIENLHYKNIDMGLDRISEVASRLNLLKHIKPFIFTVTGTNGKGSTCRILETILIEAGYKVGVYSSPHLVRYTERSRVQSVELSESLHVKSFSAIEKIRNNISLTYFEFSTLSILWLFQQMKLDIIILEVGLGGRLDATNIVDSDVSIITNIALDHINLLGSDRESIGREKAGVFRFNKPAIIGESNIPNTIIQVAKEKETKLLCYNIDWGFFINKKKWCFYDCYGKLDNLPLPHIPKLNVATALAALRVSNLKINKQSIFNGIMNASLPGRFQIINSFPRIILDVAHNPHAATYIAKRLNSSPRYGRILAVVGMMCDKDIANTIHCMNNVIDYWYCASLNDPRGANAEQLIQYVDKGKTYTNVFKALNAAMMDAKYQDTILVFGSFHTVANAMKIMKLQ